jgi:hypothetical protein
LTKHCHPWRKCVDGEFFSDLEDYKIAAFADVERSFSEILTAHDADYAVTN